MMTFKLEILAQKDTFKVSYVHRNYLHFQEEEIHDQQGWPETF